MIQIIKHGRIISVSINFKGLEQAGYGGYSLSDQILINLRFWISQNLLTAGAYSIYRVGQDSFFANEEAVLRTVPDGRFPDRTVFEGVGSFVWEQSGSVPADIFRVSGVYVDGNFIPATDTSGQFRHHIDYLNGRVIFDESVSINSTVAANYCSRGVSCGLADSREFEVIMLESIEEFLSNSGSPEATPSKEHSVWLPFVAIEVQSGRGRGLQLGGGQIKERVIVLHIFADTPGDRNFLLDTLDFQNRAAFWLGDMNSISLPFDEHGSVLPGTTNFIDLIDSHRWRKLRITEGSCKTINSLNTKLFRGQVRWSVEVDLGGV
jgi:hypothetical protein